jgi:endonuclease-3
MAAKPRPPKPELISRARKIDDVLARTYPDARCSLHFADPLQLLIATILSAQCTDERVNLVTPALFAKYQTAADYARAAPGDLERLIQSAGFFRNKAKSIRAACRDIAEKHGGNVPTVLEDLCALHGVGRKTANVVLGNAYGIPGICVDTHVGRVSRRLGLTRQDDPVKVEFDLMRLFPKERWVLLTHQFIFHGRRFCKAPTPRCSMRAQAHVISCPLLELCPHTKKSFET